LVVPDLPDLLDEVLQRLRIGLALLRDLVLERGREFAGLDPPGQVDLLRRVEQRDLADLLEVHPHHVVGGCTEEVDLDTDLGGRVGVITGNLDDLDALGREVFLDLCEEVLDLFRSEVVDRNGFEQVLGGDETALATAGDDRFLDVVDAGRLACRRGLAHRGSFAVSGTTGTVYGTARPATRNERMPITAPRGVVDGSVGARRRPRRGCGTAPPTARRRPSGSTSAAPTAADRSAISGRTAA